VAATEVVGASRAADDVERGRYATPQEHLRAGGTCDLCLGSQVISWTALEAPHATRSAHRTERNIAGSDGNKVVPVMLDASVHRNPAKPHERLSGGSRSADVAGLP
jgi:hypothetical protein